jgi:hypothetical protein
MMSNLFWFDDREPNWRKTRKLGEAWRRENPGCLIAWFGRCRSGKRWFWALGQYSAPANDSRGWSDTEEGALAAARLTAARAWGGRRVYAERKDGYARSALKQLNAKKRAAKPPSGAKGSGAVQYLYGLTHSWENLLSQPVRFQIIRKTAKRVFYSRDEEYLDWNGEPDPAYAWRRHRDEGVGFVDREMLERIGEVCKGGRLRFDAEYHLYATFDACVARLHSDRPPQESASDLHSLKMQMAAAHPDRGGSSAEFIAARERYVAAKQAGARQ